MAERPAIAPGPKLAGRLTAELISRSPQYMSCVKTYEIDLRGNKISAIENLGTTENQFDSIDLSDNVIVRLDGFPKLPRLSWLLLCNNRIARIAPNLEEQLPRLRWLVLSNNRLNNLQDLDPLWTLPKLEYLSLLDNPVTKQPNYRLYLIAKCKHLKVLDFRKVKLKERQVAAAKFGGSVAETSGAKTFEPDEELAGVTANDDVDMEEEATAKGPTPETLTAIKAAIANASTLEEVQRLEQALRTGMVPSAVKVGENGVEAAAMDED